MNSHKRLLVMLLVLSVCAAAQVRQGTVPRDSAQRYSSHTELNGVEIGAALLTKGELRKAFSADLGRCCLVVEVGIYPEKDGQVNVALDDFALRIQGIEEALRPDSVERLTARLQKDSERNPETGHDPSAKSGVSVTQTAGIGYQSGRRVSPNETQGGGVSTSTGTGVGVGVGTPQHGPEAQRREKQALEQQLRQAQLPERKSSVPVAGYLYFVIPPGMDKKAKLQLEYKPNRVQVVLPL